MYCVDLLQFAFLHTFSVERVKGREALQNLAKLRGIYQIMKEKFYDSSTFHLPRQDRGTTSDSQYSGAKRGNSWVIRKTETTG